MLKLILHQGFGDNLYARPYVREFLKSNEVALETPFPDLFDGMGISHFFKPTTTLLPTQQENVDKYPDTFWGKRTKFDKVINLTYPQGLTEGLSIPQALDTFIQPEPYDFSLTPHPIWVETAQRIVDSLSVRKPICLVKFPTQRKHYNIPSRNPNPDYFNELVKDKDYFYLDITKVNSNEWYDSNPPKMMKIDVDLHTLIGLMTLTEMSLFPPGFMIPLSIALGTRAHCVFGGYVKPELLVDERMNLDNFSYSAPDQFCNCHQATHNCNKEIKELDERRIHRLQAA